MTASPGRTGDGVSDGQAATISIWSITRAILSGLSSQNRPRNWLGICHLHCGAHRGCRTSHKFARSSPRPVSPSQRRLACLVRIWSAANCRKSISVQTFVLPAVFSRRAVTLRPPAAERERPILYRIAVPKNRRSSVAFASESSSSIIPLSGCYVGPPAKMYRLTFQNVAHVESAIEHCTSLNHLMDYRQIIWLVGPKKLHPLENRGMNL
jgi:hypothetical protein